MRKYLSVGKPVQAKKAGPGAQSASAGVPAKGGAAPKSPPAKAAAPPNIPPAAKASASEAEEP
jgi:hypothetical protein